MISEYVGVLKWLSNMEFSSKLIFSLIFGKQNVSKGGSENEIYEKNDNESFNSIPSGTRKERLSWWGKNNDNEILFQTLTKFIPYRFKVSKITQKIQKSENDPPPYN